MATHLHDHMKDITEGKRELFEFALNPPADYVG
jgi:hypothetical protein